MKTLLKGTFTGERALFASESITVEDSVFRNGESPLKESSDITVKNSVFEWKYPLWYCKDVSAENTTFLITARSGIWYTENISLRACTVEAPKTFRRAKNITIENSTMPHAEETLWNCDGVTIKDLSAVGDYFGMGSTRVFADGFSLSGNYAFDGGRDIVITNSTLISKDAFWNAENVTVENSTIIGEYLGWNSKNVKFINCTIESNQGLCYMDGVTLVGCKLINTDLAFEYSTVDADIVSEIDSVKNPTAGRIKAPFIKELIHDEKYVDVGATEIITDADQRGRYGKI
jgi:hypothetical protein